MRVLVTGGNGMLGRAVISSLGIANYEVLSPSRSEMDLEDISETINFIKFHKPEVIVHCAAFVGGISANISNPIDFLQKNIKLDQGIFFAATELKVPKLLYMGSSCMYPKEREKPMTESEILSGSLEPTNEGYALAKIVGWKNVQLIAESLTWRTLILSNLYGPNDHFESNRSHLLAAIIDKVHYARRENHLEIEMWGSGEAKREFTFVSDVADYIAEIIPNLERVPVTLNIGAGIDYSVREYYQMVCEVMEYKGKIVPNLKKPEGMKRKLMDVSAAKKYGWVPKTDIKNGIKRTVDWYLNDEMRNK
jgi:GDP-L-fucose synthase